MGFIRLFREGVILCRIGASRQKWLYTAVRILDQPVLAADHPPVDIRSWQQKEKIR